MKSTPLEHLRIVAEAAERLRAAPDSAAARRRRDEFVQLAVRHHTAREVAEAAGLAPEQLAEIVMVGSPATEAAPRPSRQLSLRRALARFARGRRPSTAAAPVSSE